jgi:hypothetical protein
VKNSFDASDLSHAVEKEFQHVVEQDDYSVAVAAVVVAAAVGASQDASSFVVNGVDAYYYNEKFSYYVIGDYLIDENDVINYTT